MLMLCLGFRFHCPPPKLIALCRNKLFYKSYVMFKLGGGSVWTLWNWVCGRNLFLQDTLSQTHTCELTPRYQQPTWNNRVATKLVVPTTKLGTTTKLLLINFKQRNQLGPTNQLPTDYDWSTISYQMQYKKTMVAKRKEYENLSNFNFEGGRDILNGNHSILSLYSP